jgi:steroid 5-alpha reductase family enzyme
VLVAVVLALFTALGVMSIGFNLAYRLKRIDVVDVYWGITVAAAGAGVLIMSPGLTPAAFIALGLIVVWSYRLSTHIARRLARSVAQDGRYTRIVNGWPKRHIWLQAYIRVFVLQAFLATLVAMPFIVISQNVAYSVWWLAAGVIIWGFGFWFEYTADTQLARFLANPRNRGKLMTTGLWRYTRHPNYFGEATMWWGIWFITIGMDYWWLGLVGPVVITLLLRFVSGVPLAERGSAKKPGWREYASHTPPFVPSVRRNN